jgi:uncharacterized protein
MDIRPVKKPLNQFLQNVAKTIKVEQLIIFGSYVEGTATMDSDVDVFVISDDFKTVALEKRLDLLDAAAEGIEPRVHPWGHTPEELNRADELTLLGYARTAGLRFI